LKYFTSYQPEDWAKWLTYVEHYHNILRSGIWPTTSQFSHLCHWHGMRKGSGTRTIEPGSTPHNP